VATLLVALSSFKNLLHAETMTAQFSTHARACASILLFGLALGLTACGSHSPASAIQQPTRGSDEQAVRGARSAQNEAIASGDIDRIAEFWTDDVEIRRGLGQLIVGRAAYRQLFMPSDASDARLVYQREPAIVTMSSKWPLAYESGTWAGHLGAVNGPAVIGGSYAAQWVKRDGRWLIRGEVFVALECAGQGCTFNSAP
jgi:ketosteroid isomerase-like protein